jgi:hypothetical protein
MVALMCDMLNQAHHCHQRKGKDAPEANRHKTSANAVVRTVMFVNDPIPPLDAITATHTVSSALLRQMTTGERDNHHKINATNVDK